MLSIDVIDIGLSPYLHILQMQEKFFNKNLECKEHNHATKNSLLLCEHPPVFTLGKSGKRENILVSDTALNAEYYHVNRGGDVTFHGPGQLVVYPILDLEQLQMGLADYIHNLEEVVIETLLQFGIKCLRIERAAGLWIIEEDKTENKICAIGVKASRNVTMHGMALNVNTDLDWFKKIVPCGLEGKGVTSMEKETGKQVNMTEVKAAYTVTFKKRFGFY